MRTLRTLSRLLTPTALQDCDEAVEKGQAARADFKARASVLHPTRASMPLTRCPLAQMLARAMTRKGNALLKKGDLEAAVAAYSKARGVAACVRVWFVRSRRATDAASACVGAVADGAPHRGHPDAAEHGGADAEGAAASGV